MMALDIRIFRRFIIIIIAFSDSKQVYAFSALCLQCFDAVGWAAGRASGL